MAPAGIGDSVEGHHAVAAALAAGRVVELVVERRRSARPELASLVEVGRGMGVDVTLVDDVRPLAATTAPQGVVARCRPMASRSLDALVAASTPASLLVVDHLEDPHNLGAIVRSAVAAGVPRMVVAERRSAPLGAAAFKAAAGAFEHMGVAVVSSVAEALRRLAGLGVWTVGLDAGGDRSLFGLPLLTEPVAIVLGGEGGGLHRLVRERVDVVAAIPMTGPTESLNVSVAAALAVFELMRVRAGAGGPSPR
jgi:23S rRNA (guanosine2251-2'-O)-methyltransferase